MFIEVSKTLKQLAKYFPENLYVVGGYVRNQILKIKSGDVDLASSVDIEEVSKRLKDSDFSIKVKNLRLGSILISSGRESFEYTAFRKEVYGDGGDHCPVSVERTDKIEVDAKRRDFSVNAIYYNINKDEVVDYYHGIVDAKQKILRCIANPDDVLKHDGERILRMVRFAGELGFKIDDKSLKSAQKYAVNIGDIQGVRRFAELEKILYCDQRYNLSKGGLKKALDMLNKLSIWQYIGLQTKKIKYNLVFKCEDRFLGLLIDIIDTEKPECLETFLEKFLKIQLGLNAQLTQKVFVYLSGYYHALAGMKNKDYFFKFYQDWSQIYKLLGARSKRLQNKYNFFYQYIIEHGLAIEFSDLAISEKDIKSKFANIDHRHHARILKNLLSKVFDGKLKNDKKNLLDEIEKNLQNY